MDERADGPGPRQPTAGIVLAGGRSRRMGRDKALLEIEGEALLARTVRVVSEVAGEVLVVGRRELPDGVTARAVPDDAPDLGPIGGIAAGLRRIDADRAVVVSCDLPFLSAAVLRLLLERSSGFDAAVPRIGEVSQPTCAVYSRACLPALDRQIGTGDYRLQSLLAELNVRWVAHDEIQGVDPGGRSFLNVNTREEWEAVLSLTL